MEPGNYKRSHYVVLLGLCILEHSEDQLESG